MFQWKLRIPSANPSMNLSRKKSLYFFVGYIHEMSGVLPTFLGWLVFHADVLTAFPTFLGPPFWSLPKGASLLWIRC